MLRPAQKRLISSMALIGTLCLVCAGCGGKSDSQPEGGSTAAQIANDPSASSSVKAQAVAQQQMASRMQQTMAQQARNEQAAATKK